MSTLKRNNIRPGFLTDLTDKRNVYLLGLLWADGCINCDSKNASFSCVNDDADCPRRLFLENGIITSTVRQRKYHGESFGRPAYIASFRLTGMEGKLKGWDMHHKVSPVRLLSEIPDHLKHYWWRGYFDGDGCLHIRVESQSLAFWSTYDQDWSFVHHLTDKLGFPSCKITRYKRKGGRHCSSTWTTHRQDIICAFMRYIYQGDDVNEVGLKRKHNKYLQLLDKQKAIIARRGEKRSKYQHVVKVTTGTGKVRWHARHWQHGHIGVFDTDDEAGKAMNAFLLQNPSQKKMLPDILEYASDC